MTERSISIAGYSFAANKASFVCKHVGEGHSPVLGFLHEQDGFIHFTCGLDDHPEDDWVECCLSHVLGEHPDLVTLPVVEPGFEAWRLRKGDAWQVKKADLG